MGGASEKRKERKKDKVKRGKLFLNQIKIRYKSDEESIIIQRNLIYCLDIYIIINMWK